MNILKNRVADQNLTFSQAYPEEKKYVLIKNPYLRAFFSEGYQDDLLKGSDFPKHSISDFHLPDVYPNKLKEARVLLYLNPPRNVPYRTWERSYLNGDDLDKQDRDTQTLLKILKK